MHALGIRMSKGIFYSLSSRALAVCMAGTLVSLGALGCGNKEQSGTPGSESVVKEPKPAETGANNANAQNAANAGDKKDEGTAAKPEGSQAAAPAENAGGAVKADPSKAAAAKPGETPAPAAPEPSATASAVATATPEPTSAAGTARTAEAGPPVEGTKVGESNFSVWMQSAPKHKVGQPGSVQVVLVPKNGFKCNAEYPYKLKLNDPPAGVSYPNAIVRKESMSVSPKQSTMNVPFTPTAAGDARISGKFYFSVCTADQCLIDSRDVAVNVKIEP